ncbi:DUF2695 domain-containing protein [Adhaeretor mobilis]|uniref:DUF2695 domain-containing protein n=1 Tax=Adhaeretor mobilis TaxID=1930276 RepID=A0A517MS66_9BACT|nr:DUF2695 domain-containing protein [Adhaeretor mobilis]QDS97617.1 hypothetical protein HG15A2_08800 [Adhaeretor mobilis]
MKLDLDELTVGRMVAFVDSHLRRDGCDHTHRFASQWSREHNIDWDDLLDAFEQRGAFCDCEVVLNLQDSNLSSESESSTADHENRWLLPPNFASNFETTNRMLVARADIGKNNYASDGEWVVPAPLDAKPRKRVRKSVHYFVGLDSGLPTEIAFIQSIEPIALDKLTEKIRESTIAELQNCDDRLAGFIAKKIAKMADGAAVGTDIMDRVGVASKHKELTIHRVILRR